MNTINWNNASPEQQNLWNYVKGLIAYSTITPLFAMGDTSTDPALAEFLVQSPNKIYLALELTVINIDTARPLPVTAQPLIIINDHNGVPLAQVIEADMLYQVAYKYMPLMWTLKNFYFGALVVADYHSIKFNGYRLDV